MRLLFAIPSLCHGGAQRVVATLANHWAAGGSEVSILTLAGPDDAPAYPLHRGVKRISLDVMSDSHGPGGALVANARRVLRIRAAIRAADPDAVISFMLSMNVLVLLAGIGLGVRVVVSERTHPHTVPGPPVWRFLAQRLYHRAAAIVVQTQAALEFFTGSLAARCRVIPNPVDERFGERADDERPGPVLAAMGRLEVEKGFDLLIRAFAAVAGQMPDWRLEIWGEGPERERLSFLIASLAIQDRVSLMGATAAPERVYATAGAFVLSSRSEGYPNVLCEAMACGLPAIAFDCPSGPAEIIEHERTGILVPAADAPALSAALLRVAGSPALREELGSRARSIRSRLAPERIAEAWARVLAAPAAVAGEVRAEGVWR